jgi:hypothetical protein
MLPVLSLLKFISDNILEEVFYNKRNKVIFHVVCYEHFASACNLTKFLWGGLMFVYLVRNSYKEKNNTHLIVQNSIFIINPQFVQRVSAFVTAIIRHYELKTF